MYIMLYIWGVFYTHVSKSGVHVHRLNVFIFTNTFRQVFSFKPIYNNLERDCMVYNPIFTCTLQV